jgi:hypothetical protein
MFVSGRGRIGIVWRFILVLVILIVLVLASDLV